MRPAIFALIFILCAASAFAAGSPCANGVKDGYESDVDCGGSCSPCANGKMCSTSADCASSYCNAGICASISGSCSDGIKNGQETDIDCGGYTCDPCVTGQICILSSDCESSVCNGGVCYPPAASCTDGIENGNEAGIDCGGSCPDACPGLRVKKGDLDPGNHYWSSSNDEDNIMMQVRIDANGKKPINVKVFKLSASGSGDDAYNVANVRVVLDANGNGLFDAYPDVVLGSRVYAEDNGDITITLQPPERLMWNVDVGDEFLIVYTMKPTASGTYTVTLTEVIGELDDGSDEQVSAAVSLSNTKTVDNYVPPSCNMNGVRDSDESGVDCGGAYCPQCTGTCANGVRDANEEGVDCGGSCPTCPLPRVHCPNGVQDGDETGIDCGGADCPACGCQPACDPSSAPICDDNSRTASICISGIYQQVPGLYESQCVQQPSCTPGTSICFEGTVTLCSPVGVWSPAVDDPALWSRYCENDACNGQDDFCAASGMHYTCRNGEYTYQGPCAETTECNPGEIDCDYAGYSFRRCDSSGHWATPTSANVAVIGVQDGFFDYCPMDIPECNAGTTRCDISEEDSVFWYCDEDDSWVADRDPQSVRNNCFPRECEFGDTQCDYEHSEYRVCNANGEWLVNARQPGAADDGADDTGANTLFGAPNRFNRNPYLATGLIVVSDPQVFTENCANQPDTPQECVPLTEHCETLDDGVMQRFFCNEQGFWELGDRAAGDCPVRVCDAGDTICDYQTEEYFVCENNAFVQSHDYGQACQEGIPPEEDVLIPDPVCVGAERQCNVEFDREEICVGGQWLPVEQSGDDYRARCENVECNDGWFACNPVSERVSFCDDGQWGPERVARYDELCGAPEASIGGNPNGGPAFARSDDRVLIGDEVNGEIVVIRSIPGFPTTPPAPLAQQQCQKFPWWIWLVIGLLACFGLFEFTKYHHHLKLDKRK